MKKKLLFIFAVLLRTLTLNADPAWPDSVLVYQPDGTNLWVYDRGDEY